MTTHSYLCVRRLTPKPLDWSEAFFEIRPDNRVTRMVTVDEDGKAVCNSVAIMSHRHTAYADAVTGDDAPCIYGQFPAPGAYDSYWPDRDCTFESISAGEFQKCFTRARPSL
jgi:hypothetical protein